MKMPWYIKSFYDKDKDVYILKINKAWAIWTIIKQKLLLRWLRKNAYLYNWKILSKDIEISDSWKYWKVPTSEDLKELKGDK